MNPTDAAEAEGTDAANSATVGMVSTKDGWMQGTLGKMVDGTKHRITFINPDGKSVTVTRDTADKAQWIEGATEAPADSTPAPKAKVKKQPKAKASKPKVDASVILEYATGAAKRGANKFPRDAQFHTCTGKCGKRKKAAQFPTIAGTEFRVSECRSCRDERRGVKAPAAEAQVALAR